MMLLTTMWPTTLGSPFFSRSQTRMYFSSISSPISSIDEFGICLKNILISMRTNNDNSGIRSTSLKRLKNWGAILDIFFWMRPCDAMQWTNIQSFIVALCYLAAICYIQIYLSTLVFILSINSNKKKKIDWQSNHFWFLNYWSTAGIKFNIWFFSLNVTQLRWRGPPDSSDSSLILVGWCEEGHPATKNLLQLSQG